MQSVETNGRIRKQGVREFKGKYYKNWQVVGHKERWSKHPLQELDFSKQLCKYITWNNLINAVIRVTLLRRLQVIS